jgi:predicted phosphodiesterase
MHKKLALFGGVYSNHLALKEMIKDAHSQNIIEIYCLGDLGAFGPNPDKVFPIIKKYRIPVVKGNYDNSIGNGLNDCQCGYTDPRDNYYAKLSYDYTFTKTSEENKMWMKELPSEKRIEINGRKLFLCHGSPRQTNEFLWETTTPTHFLEKLCKDYDADIICATHTGIHWDRKLTDGKRFINAGVLGRPENDGSTQVGYTILEFDKNDLKVEYRKIDYDYEQLVFEMKKEKLPEEFIETILTGWWTTCLEVLPGKERLRGKY